MDPPRPPRPPPERQKESPAVADVQMVDDTTLLSFISILYAVFHYFTQMNAPQCTC